MGLISRVSSRTYRQDKTISIKFLTMGGPSRSHGGNGKRKFNKFTGKIKRAGKKKDDDILFNNLTNSAKAKKLQNQQVDLEKPGMGQHYCIITDRYFKDAKAHEAHKRGKSYKQKVKSLLKDKPYSHEEADAVGGMGSYVKPEVTKEEAEKIKINAAHSKAVKEAAESMKN